MYILKGVGDIRHLILAPLFVISNLELTDRPVFVQLLVSSCIPSVVLVKCSRYRPILILSNNLSLSSLSNAFMQSVNKTRVYSLSMKIQLEHDFHFPNSCCSSLSNTSVIPLFILMHILYDKLREIMPLQLLLLEIWYTNALLGFSITFLSNLTFLHLHLVLLLLGYPYTDLGVGSIISVYYPL